MILDKESILINKLAEIKTSVEYTLGDDRASSIAITSSKKSDGKTFFSRSFANIHWGESEKIIVIDTDVYSQNLSKKYRLKNNRGLIQYIRNHDHLDNLYVKIGEIYVLPVGQMTGTMNQNLFDSTSINKLKKELYARGFTKIIFDCSPVLLFSEPAVIASCCDLCILLLSYNSTKEIDLMRCKEKLNRLGMHNIAAVLNKSRYVKNDYVY